MRILILVALVAAAVHFGSLGVAVPVALVGLGLLWRSYRMDRGPR